MILLFYLPYYSVFRQAFARVSSIAVASGGVVGPRCVEVWLFRSARRDPHQAAGAIKEGEKVSLSPPVGHHQPRPGLFICSPAAQEQATWKAHLTASVRGGYRPESVSSAVAIFLPRWRSTLRARILPPLGARFIDQSRRATRALFSGRDSSLVRPRGREPIAAPELITACVLLAACLLCTVSLLYSTERRPAAAL